MTILIKQKERKNQNPSQEGLKHTIRPRTCMRRAKKERGENRQGKKQQALNSPTSKTIYELGSRLNYGIKHKKNTIQCK